MICSICGCRKFISDIQTRPYKACAECGAMERHRLLWTYWMESRALDFGGTMLEIAPLNRRIYGDFLRTECGLDYVCADKYPRGNPSDPRNVEFCDMYFGLEDMDSHIPARSQNYFVMQHVLEEIPDYMKCLRNIYDVLKPGGRAWLEIPVMDSIDMHQRTDANRFGNVWNFSRRNMIAELAGIFDDVVFLVRGDGHYEIRFYECMRKNE